MSSKRQQRLPARAPKRGPSAMRPGERLRENVLPALARLYAEIARLLSVSRQTLHSIVTERQPVTPLLALKLGKLCGNGPDLWLALQARHDLEKLGNTKRAELVAIPTIAT